MFGGTEDQTEKFDHQSCVVYQFPVVSRVSSATDETGSVPVEAARVRAGTRRNPTRSILRRSGKTLSERDLLSPTIRHLLIEDIDRLEAKNTKLESDLEEYQKLRVDYAVLTESTKRERWIEILSFVCLAVGSAGLGAAPGYFGLGGGNTSGYTMLALSVILVLGGLVPRIFK